MEMKRRPPRPPRILKAAQPRIKHVTGELVELRKAAKAPRARSSRTLQKQYETETAALAELDAQLKGAKGDEKEAELFVGQKALEASVHELREEDGRSARQADRAGV